MPLIQKQKNIYPYIIWKISFHDCGGIPFDEKKWAVIVENKKPLIKPTKNHKIYIFSYYLFFLFDSVHIVFAEEPIVFIELTVLFLTLQ